MKTYKQGNKTKGRPDDSVKEESKRKHVAVMIDQQENDNPLSKLNVDHRGDNRCMEDKRIVLNGETNTYRDRDSDQQIS